MDEKITAEIKAITAGIVLVFSIVALCAINGALAWFAYSDSVDTGGMNVEIASKDKAEFSIECYKITDITLSGGTNYYHFEAVDAADRRMDDYSALSGKRQMLIKISIPDSVDYVKITANSSTSQYPVQDGVDIDKQTTLGLSPVIEMYVFDNLELDNGEYVVGEASLTNALTFTTFDSKDEPSFSSNIDLYGNSVQGVENIFIFVDYYEKSMDYVLTYINMLMMDDKHSDYEYKSGEIIPFVNDFTIYISTEE